MNKKFVVLSGLLMAAVVMSMTLLSAAKINGPFHIKPNEGETCSSPLVLKLPAGDPSANCFVYWPPTWTQCCSWAYSMYELCENQQGNNCYTEDKYAGACCYGW